MSLQFSEIRIKMGVRPGLWIGHWGLETSRARERSWEFCLCILSRYHKDLWVGEGGLLNWACLQLQNMWSHVSCTNDWSSCLAGNTFDCSTSIIPTANSWPKGRFLVCILLPDLFLPSGYLLILDQVGPCCWNTYSWAAWVWNFACVSVWSDSIWAGEPKLT